MLHEDLKELMLRCLETEKQTVMEELNEYCCSIVIVLTPEGRYVRRAAFLDEDEKVAAYAEIVAEAKRQSALAIVTVNAARTRKLAPGEEAGYWWGKLEAEGARDCISISASGPGMESYGLDLAYDIVGDHVQFDALPEFEKTEIGMLPDWPGDLPTSPN
jgi:hypothetical protein